MISISHFFLQKALSQSIQFGRRGVFAIPHPAKKHRGGEDAFFIHSSGIGVADGVGGLAMYGIDPALFTRNVMRFSLEILKRDRNLGTVTALEVLDRATTEAVRAGQPGSCPATLVTLIEGKYASVLNLGDCGTVMIRSSKLFFQTDVQQHKFNCPYQLPDDAPSSGDIAKLEVKSGDIFLCGSDGLFDNVELDDIVCHLGDLEHKGCRKVAEELARHAFLNGNDRKLLSPFSKHASASGFQYLGGKLDDITVVVAQITDKSVEPNSCSELITDFLNIKMA